MELDPYKNLICMGQSHVFSEYDEMTETEQDNLKKSISSINFLDLKRCFEAFHGDREYIDEKSVRNLYADQIKGYGVSSQQDLSDFYQLGLDMISGRKVAAVVLSGGAGSRLGVDYPKGLYDVGLKSHKTLFQLQAERILRLQELASKQTGSSDIKTPWLIMTSELTQTHTQSFFSENNYFGLDPNYIKFFEQGAIPSVNNDGELVLGKKDEILMSPFGNGDLFSTLLNTGMIDYLRSEGVEALFVYCVDNILIRVLDPYFIGCCSLNSADVACKYVKMTDPEELLGRILLYKESAKILEYSEIPTQLSQKRDADTGDLTYNAGNICIHYFTMDFIEKFARLHLHEMPIHLARKKIPYYDQRSSRQVVPDVNNGVKFEKFITDSVEFSENFLAYCVNRDEEFSPLKNSSGKHTALTCKMDLLRCHVEYKRRAGLLSSPVEDIESHEISPLESYADEGL